MSIVITKLFKGIFVNSVDTENYQTLNQFGLLSDLEQLFELNIPSNQESFDQIETLTNETLSSTSTSNSRNFFKAFEKVDPKLNFLQDFLSSTLKQTHETKLSHLNFISQSNSFMSDKKARLKEFEQLYAKLCTVVDRCKNAPENIFQENVTSYL